MGVFRDQFQKRNFLFDYPDQSAFENSRFSSDKTTYYLIWRLLWAVYHTSWLAMGLVTTYLDTDKTMDKWLIYLSHWVYVLLVVTCWLDGLIVVVGKRRKQSTDQETLSGPSSRRYPITWYQKVTWCLTSVVSTGCIMVTLWYWLTDAKGKQITAVRLHFHGINALYVLANLIVSRIPVRLLHFLYPAVFGVLYMLFTAGYHYGGWTNQQGEPFIYKAVDWSKPQRTFNLSSISNFIFIPIVHVSLWCLSVAVDKLLTRWTHSPKNHQQIEDTSFSDS